MAAASWKARILPSNLIVTKAAQQYPGVGTTGECHAARLFLFYTSIPTVSEPVMAGKRPLCMYDGIVKELETSDSLIGVAEGLVSRDVPSGLMNRSNVEFVLANTPISGSEQVFLNGVLQNWGDGNDYTISTSGEVITTDNTITFAVAPLSTDIILVTYWKTS